MINRRKLLRDLNKVLQPTGFQLTKSFLKGGASRQGLCDPSSSHMQDPLHHTLLIDELSETASAFFSDSLSHLSSSGEDMREWINVFFETYSRRPFSQNEGGSGFHNAFWIYLVCRILNPNFIVESGVWKGHTSWLFEQACTDTTILGFDINLGNVEHRSARVNFLEQDWSSFEFGAVDGDRALAFFDCHVNHARRILEAHERGFRHLLFDDNPPLHELYAYGLPGFPTAQMIVDSPDPEAAEVSWTWRGQKRTCATSAGEISSAKKLIRRHEVFPDVGGPTKYGGFSFLTYVEIE